MRYAFAFACVAAIVSLMAGSAGGGSVSHAMRPSEGRVDTLHAPFPAPPCDYVNPFVGTDEMGHTFPGAASPFGLVQLSPETDTILYSYDGTYNPGVYRYCSGYQYDDRTIVGFSHTHMSGTGHSDLGDVLLMPTTGPLRLNPGTADDPGSGYRSRFSHEREEASPGYYAVTLDDYGIRAELTATERVGFHRYTFPGDSGARVILDLTSGIYNYDGKVVWSSIRIESDTLVTGYRQTSGWARDRRVYFAMAFSRPIASYGLRNDEPLVYRGFWRRWNESDNFPERAGRAVKGHFDFDARPGEAILVKVALSGVSTENAVSNLRAEIPGWDFNGTRASVRAKWNAELSRIVARAESDRLVNLYTALYHCFLSPSIFSDVNGEYRGLDGNIHRAEGFTNHTVFSLWDTYRALHPLLTILQQERTNDIISSMLAHYVESVHHILPIWSHWANENWCMIGYHAVPVIADAYLKGIRGYDVDMAYEAVLASAAYDDYDGIGAYRRIGYVPEDVSGNSASKTLEYAYDDWTIYRFAKARGDDREAAEFQRRSASYRNLFDPGTRFMRARLSDGSWKAPFDPLATSGQGFIEGNAWNYSLYVPHDMAGFMELIGGEDALVAWLDTLFEMRVPEESYAHTEDVTIEGIIGGYVHGNEPSHHVPYLYSYAGQPWKTQERVHQIVNAMYRNEADGLGGNDDCGQMSAWYVFSCLGFYPVCPGSGEYVIGSPCVERAEIRLENGETFSIEARNSSSENIYIQSVTLNGRSHDALFITHDEILRGGELVFEMGPSPAPWPAGASDPDLMPGTTRAAGRIPYSMSRSVE
jgi:predicted alpha-1,2-mannosidase